MENFQFHMYLYSFKQNKKYFTSYEKLKFEREILNFFLGFAFDRKRNEKQFLIHNECTYEYLICFFGRNKPKLFLESNRKL